MFEIYKFEYDCQFITTLDLQSYVNMGILTQTQYHEIVGDSNANAQAVAPQSQV